MSFLASLTKIVSTVGGMLTGPVIPAVQDHEISFAYIVVHRPHKLGAGRYL